MFALCVDDENLTLQSLVRAVQKSPDIDGVMGFDDEIDALDWAKDNPVDIAFLDIELHEMNGIELAKRLAELHPDISVIFCTGYEQYALNAIRLHMDAGYLVKPFRASHVQEEIDHVVRKKGGGPSPAPITRLSPGQTKNTVMIRMMGEFSITINGKSNTLLWSKMKKGAVFLEYLILNYGIQVPKQRLISLFWSDYLYSNPDSAIKALVSRLRKALDEIRDDLENCIVSETGSYSFRLLPDMFVDVLRIQEILRLLPGEKDPQKREELFRELMTLYTGDLYLPGDTVDGNAYIFDLHFRFLAAVNSHTDELMEQKNYPQVIEICKQASQIDPFDETLRMRIMTAYKESGHPEEAQEEYHRLRALHKKHLNTEPSEDMQKFYQELL